MIATGSLRRGLVVAAMALPWAVVWPSSEGLVESTARLDAPIDASLRVPFGAAFLPQVNDTLETRDRILDVVLEGQERLIAPRSRKELSLALRDVGEASVRVRLMRGREEVTVTVPRAHGSGWRAIARNWPAVLLGAAFLLFGLATSLGSRHPVVSPLVAVSWCVGASGFRQSSGTSTSSARLWRQSSRRRAKTPADH